MSAFGGKADIGHPQDCCRPSTHLQRAITGCKSLVAMSVFTFQSKNSDRKYHLLTGELWLGSQLAKLRESPWLRRRTARVDRLVRRVQNSSIRFRKCAVTGWRVQRPKSNSASNCRKN